MASISVLDAPNRQQKIKVATVNLWWDVVSMKNPNTHFSKRSQRLEDLIREIYADVVFFQELREYPDCETPAQFLLRFSKEYEIIFRKRNATDMAFGQAILVKKKIFFPGDEVLRYLSNTPEIPSDDFGEKPGFGSIVLGVKLWFKHGSAVRLDVPPLWVFNTHFALDEQVKTNSCHALISIVDDIVTPGHPFIVGGDFNCFPDKDGALQKSILCDRWCDGSKGAVTVRSGTPVVGTFVGSNDDPNKSSLVPSEMLSDLDHVYGSSDKTVMEFESPTLYNLTMLDVEPEEFSTRDYPSDHWPVVVNVTIH